MFLPETPPRPRGEAAGRDLGLACRRAGGRSARSTLHAGREKDPSPGSFEGLIVHRDGPKRSCRRSTNLGWDSLYGHRRRHDPTPNAKKILANADYWVRKSTPRGVAPKRSHDHPDQIAESSVKTSGTATRSSAAPDPEGLPGGGKERRVECRVTPNVNPPAHPGRLGRRGVARRGGEIGRMPRRAQVTLLPARVSSSHAMSDEITQSLDLVLRAQKGTRRR
jgi:hypothetical protein